MTEEMNIKKKSGLEKCYNCNNYYSEEDFVEIEDGFKICKSCFFKEYKENLYHNSESKPSEV